VMRVATGKGNDARKILTYYRVNFGVRGPYRVLCDGALIHLALKRSVNLRESLPALLGGPASAMVTRCVHEELCTLGADTAVANGNPKGLLLASTDATLLRAVRFEHGLPLLRLANETRLVLMPPSAATQSAVTAREAMKGKVQRLDDSRLIAREDAVVQAARAERAARRVAKRKRPSGPKPLSVKKPKRESSTPGNPAHSSGVPATHSPSSARVVLSGPARKLSKRELAISEFATIDTGDVGMPLWDAGVSEQGRDKTQEVCPADDKKKPKRIRKRKPKPVKVQALVTLSNLDSSAVKPEGADYVEQEGTVEAVGTVVVAANVEGMS
jgi:U3 small nucleolar RNA-associated protein 23